MPVTPTPPPERFTSHTPTANPPPQPHAPVPLVKLLLCGECPAWKQQNPLFPFGQCIAAIRALGAPMYTPNMSGCTLSADDRLKYAKAAGLK